jgi:hypothetical protein
MKISQHSRWALLLSIATVFLVAAGCRGGSVEDSQQTDLRMAPIGQLPLQVQQAAVAVREAYQFTVANTEIVRQFPCFCGCGPMGHTSNASCYLADAAALGRPKFDAHALGCSICVDITQDVMRKMRQGVDLAEIRSFVDATYAQYGPSNME